MQNLKKYLLLSAFSLGVISCQNSDDSPVANNVTLEFNNTFKNTTIVLGDLVLLPPQIFLQRDRFIIFQN
jgi:hypothetical protein